PARVGRAVPSGAARRRWWPALCCVRRSRRGRCERPGPEGSLAAGAAQTGRVHLGSAILNITPPVNKPQRVAENVALLDHLTNNRFEFGTGRGSSTTEVLGFDIPSVEITKAMWRETIREIPKMWKDRPYSFEGEFFRMPERNV